MENEIFNRNINIVKAIALIFGIMFQFIFFKEFSNKLIILAPVGFYIFFIVSGCQIMIFISNNENNSKSSLMSFLKLRMLSLLPPLTFWILTANIFALFVNSSGAFGPFENVFNDSITIISGTMNIFKTFAFNQYNSPYFNVLGTYWHITFEEQVAIFLFLIFSIYPQKRKETCLFLLLFSLLILFISPDIKNYYYPYFITFSPSKNLVHFITGAFAGVLFYKKNCIKNSSLNFSHYVYLILLLTLISNFFINYRDPINFSFLLIFEFLIISMLLNIKTSPSKIYKPLEYIGERFYEIYLGHAIVIRLVEEIHYRIFKIKSDWTGLPLLNAFLCTIISIVLMIYIGNILYLWTKKFKKPII